MFEKMKGMSFKEKVEYYFEYYGLVTAIVIFALIFVISMTCTIIKNSRVKPAASIIVINSLEAEEPEELETLFENILTENNLDLKRNTIDVLNNITVGDNYDAQSSYYGTTQLQAYFVSGESDVIFCSEDYLDTLIGFDAMCDISSILPADVIAEHEADLIYYTDEETGETFPTAVYVDPDSELMQISGWYLSDTKVAVGIGYNAVNTDVAEEIVLKALGE